GVRLAVDVHLPADRPGEALPTILRQTRYFRGVDFREPFGRLPIEFLLDHASDTRSRFLAQGYAWVDVCVRGSGASFGRRPCPWSPDEIADGREIVDWIVAQPWCNGRVGTTGVSYDGTTSEFLVVNAHPAVAAACPRFALFDVYTDVAFPGGIHLAWFTEAWSAFNRALDEGALDRAFAMMLQVQVRALLAQPYADHPAIRAILGLAESPRAVPFYLALVRQLARGVRPVEGDRALLRAAIEAHRDNFDVHHGALAVQCRDDAGISDVYPDATIDSFSPHAHAEALRQSGTPIYGLSGWLDAAYQNGAIKRFRAVDTAGSRLTIGPWDHGGLGHVSPYSAVKRAAFDQDAELIRFFDHHLRDRHVDDPPVRYFTMGEEAWKSADVWPPPGTQEQVWYLGPERCLQPTAPLRAGADDYRVDRDLGTGRSSRWDTLLGLLPPVRHTGRESLGKRMLVYRSRPLAAPLEVTGHPVAHLDVTVDRPAAHVFVYLEEETASGEVHYITEGQLDGEHRAIDGVPPYPMVGPHHSFRRADRRPVVEGAPMALAIELLPISYRLAAGSRLRLAIAGADADHFAPLTVAPTFHLRWGGASTSHLVLPVQPSRR
ncbi:MAG: CocE/NonD family hydrolase, partial [Myxococcales bacterium]|nr:CocE/NonD family hydrolase [Myxococcales bacterium]